MPSTKTRSALGAAAISGAVAYVVGYAATYLATSDALEGATLTDLLNAFGDGEPVPQLVGWVFYNAHFVGTTIDVAVPFVGGTGTVDLIAESAALSPILYAIPPALLFAAGVVAARATGATETDDALRIGPAVTIGYLPLVIVGTVLFTVTVGDSSGKPALLPAIAVAGVLYPVVFGTLGAIVATALGNRSA